MTDEALHYPAQILEVDDPGTDPMRTLAIAVARLNQVICREIGAVQDEALIVRLDEALISGSPDRVLELLTDWMVDTSDPDVWPLTARTERLIGEMQRRVDAAERDAKRAREGLSDLNKILEARLATIAELEARNGLAAKRLAVLRSLIENVDRWYDGKRPPTHDAVYTEIGAMSSVLDTEEDDLDNWLSVIEESDQFMKDIDGA